MRVGGEGWQARRALSARPATSYLARRSALTEAPQTMPTTVPFLRPRALRRGDAVALVAPAGPLAPGAVERAEERVRALGWEPLTAPHARGRRGFLSGSDEERLGDLNAALSDPRTRAVWCLRGGYGTMRILPRIEWETLVRRRLPLIGFSDNTALHLGCAARGLVSFHAPHPAAEEVEESSLLLLHRLLSSDLPLGPLPEATRGPPPEMVTGGVAEGRLCGGNLSLLAATLGTPYAPRAEGCILFLEEVGEPPYRLDRLLTQLELAGVLRGVVGVAVGDLGGAGEEAAELAEVVRERLGRLGVPVVQGLPFGHRPENWTLPLGVSAQLDAETGTLALLDPAVAEGEA
jgi:muramoyltetrapeptide carboxypeptidase